MCLIHEAFDQFQEGGTIPRQKILLALYQIGQYLAKQTIDDWLQERMGENRVDDGIDLETFKDLVSHLRSRSLEKWRQTYGFSSDQMEHFKKFYTIACEEGPCGGESIPLDRVQTVMERLGYSVHLKSQGTALLS